MKYLISFILILTFYTRLSDAECNPDEWKVISSKIDINRLIGRWYTYKTYADGHTDCIWHDVSNHPTQPDTVVSSISILYKNETKNSKITTKADVTLLDPSKLDGKVHVLMEIGAVAIKHVIAIDYDEFAITRTCIDDVEFVAIYLRCLYPSKDTVDKINEIVEENGIDQSKLITACAELNASEIV